MQCLCMLSPHKVFDIPTHACLHYISDYNILYVVTYKYLWASTIQQWLSEGLEITPFSGRGKLNYTIFNVNSKTKLPQGSINCKASIQVIATQKR